MAILGRGASAWIVKLMVSWVLAPLLLVVVALDAVLATLMRLDVV